MKKPKPDGWPNVAPRLFSDDVAGLVGFIRAVFDASGEIKQNAPSELRIGDSVLLVSDGGAIRDASSAFLYVYVADADEVHRRAGAAGAGAIEEPTDTPYGDRRATRPVGQCLADRDLWRRLAAPAMIGEFARHALGIIEHGEEVF